MDDVKLFDNSSITFFATAILSLLTFIKIDPTDFDVYS